MKHWDGRDLPEATELPLSAAERGRLRALFEPPAHRRPARMHMGSVIGLASAVTLLALLAWALSPSDPVSPHVLP